MKTTNTRKLSQLGEHWVVAKIWSYLIRHGVQILRHLIMLALAMTVLIVGVLLKLQALLVLLIRLLVTWLIAIEQLKILLRLNLLFKNIVKLLLLMIKMGLQSLVLLHAKMHSIYMRPFFITILRT